MPKISWILLLTAVSTFPSLAQANLLDEVDQLTPEQAYLLGQKLQAKVYSPVPESFFTHLTVELSGGVAVYDPSNFNNYLAPNPKVSTAGFWQFDVRWKLSDHFLLGLESTFSSLDQTHEPSPNVFHEISIAAPSADLSAAFRIDLSDDFYLLPGIAVGGIFAWVTEQTTTDANKTTYNFTYSGSAFHAAVELPIFYRLNRIWSIGLTNAFQAANITALERSENHAANVPNLNLTGYQGSFTLAFNL